MSNNNCIIDEKKADKCMPAINFTDANIEEFIKFIINFDTINDILETCRNQSERGLIFEKIFDIIIKFGFCKAFSNITYQHMLGNVNIARLKVLNCLEQYAKNKVFSGNSSGVSDITLRDKSDGTYIFISSKYPKSRGSKSVEYYDVQNIVAVIAENKEIYKKYKIYLVVPHRDRVIETFERARESSEYITRHITRETILDKADLNEYFTDFKLAIKYASCFGKQTWTEQFLAKKSSLRLRFHQELITQKTNEMINAGKKSFLWGCKCRSGKTYMVGGLILKQLIVKKKLNVLVITPAPTETIPQFTDDLFHKFQEFDQFNIREICGANKERMVEQDDNLKVFDSVEKINDKSNIFIVSKQFLQKYTGDAALKFIKNLNLDIIFVDETHYSGTTELAKEIYASYAHENTAQVYLTATYRKPLTEWNIDKECQMYWDIEDEQICKTIFKNTCAHANIPTGDDHTQQANIALAKLCARHGLLQVNNLINFCKTELCLSLSDIFACYNSMPDLHVITNMFDAERYEDIKSRLDGGSKFGFCFDTLFALNKSKTSFLFEREVQTILRYISGSYKEIDGEKTIFTRVYKLCATENSRIPFTQIWFLPSDNIGIVSKCLRCLMQKDRVLAKYDVLCINRTDKENKFSKRFSVRDEITKTEIIAKERGRAGVILLAGNMLSLGITLALCDMVILMNNSLSSDKVMQQMYRCMTEGKDKTIGVVVDLNISRVLNVCVNYSLFTESNDKPNDLRDAKKESSQTIDDKIKYIIDYHLINIDVDLLQNRKINSHDIIKKLLDIWKIDPINAFRLLLRKLDDECAAFDSDTQKIINKTFARSAFNDKITLQVIMKDSPDDLQEFPSGKEIIKPIDIQKEKEKEEEKQITISFSKEVLPYIIPLTCILTLKTDNMDFVKMLNHIKKTPELLSIFDDQCLIWWNKKDLVDLVKTIVDKFFRKDSNTYNISLQFKSSLQSLIDRPKELLELINECLKPKSLEKRSFGEVFTPLNFINNSMLRDIEEYWLKTYNENIWTNEKLTWCDPAAGMGNYPIAIYYKLMDGLKAKIPRDDLRAKHIIEKQLFMGELNKKNCFIIRQIFNINDDLKLNLYCGDTLAIDLCEVFDDKLKSICLENENASIKNKSLENEDDSIKNTSIKGLIKFDIVIGNPPYNEELTRIGAKPLYHKFIMCYLDKCKLLSFIVPSRWFAGGKGLDKFRAMMLNRTDILYIKHFDDACKIFGNLVDIKGGVNYFLINKDYKGLCEYNGKQVQFNKFDILLDAKYYDIVNKLLDKEMITRIYSGRFFEIESNDKRLVGEKARDEKKEYLRCYVSQQKGFIKYIEKEHVKKDTTQYRVITARANGTHGSGFGNTFVGQPGEVHTGSYISFKVSSEVEAKSLVSYLACRLPNFMLSLRKISQDISEATCKWVPLPPLNREWDDDAVYRYYLLSEEMIALVRGTKIGGYRELNRLVAAEPKEEAKKEEFPPIIKDGRKKYYLIKDKTLYKIRRDKQIGDYFGKYIDGKIIEE